MSLPLRQDYLARFSQRLARRCLWRTPWLLHASSAGYVYKLKHLLPRSHPHYEAFIFFEAIYGIIDTASFLSIDLFRAEISFRYCRDCFALFRYASGFELTLHFEQCRAEPCFIFHTLSRCQCFLSSLIIALSIAYAARRNFTPREKGYLVVIDMLLHLIIFLHRAIWREDVDDIATVVIRTASYRHAFDYYTADFAVDLRYRRKEYLRALALITLSSRYYIDYDFSAQKLESKPNITE